MITSVEQNKIEEAIEARFGYMSTVHPEPIVWGNPEF